MSHTLKTGMEFIISQKYVEKKRGLFSSQVHIPHYILFYKLLPSNYYYCSKVDLDGDEVVEEGRRPGEFH